MKYLTTLFLITVSFLFTTTSDAQLKLRDDFNRAANPDLSTSAAPLKWFKLTTQPNASASLQINSDSTISPINSSGALNAGGVAWDSLLTDTTQIGLVVRQKAGNGTNTPFMINVRMAGRDLTTGNGYRLSYFDIPTGTDQVLLQRVTNGTTGTTLATLNREIAVGDTLIVKVEANKTMKALVWGANGIRDSISAVDNTYNPSTWYTWLRGTVFATPVKMDNFFIGRIPQIFPVFSVAPTSLSFGSVGVTSGGKLDSVTVTNTGNSALTITSVVSNNAQFTVTPTSGTIAASASQKFYITFAPTSAGLKNGTITFTHNAAGSPSAVAVSGTGVTLTTITSFTPTSGPAGTSITITGANFSTTLANNIVYFGAVKGTVTAATASTLTVTVPSGATYFPITVTAGGLTAYSQVPFIVTFPSNRIIDSTSLAPHVDFPAGDQPFALAVGDIDGDGKPDIEFANNTTFSAMRNISVVGSITTGSFEPQVLYGVGNNAYILAMGDLDADGKLDLAVTNEADSSVSVFRNTSTAGSFSPSTFAPRLDLRTQKGPQGIAIRDLDGDGKSELIVSNDTNGTVSVYRNIGTPGSITAGSFAARVDFPTGLNPRMLEIGDVDGDGKPDIITPNFAGNNFSVLRNTSTSGVINASSFAAPINITTGTNPKSAALGDYDGDGKPDVAVSHYGFNTVAVFRNLSTPGTISFSSRVDFLTGEAARSVVANDMDGDGKLDLIAVNELDFTVTILKNTATPGSITTGSFAPRVNFPVPARPIFLAVTDFDGDGKPDVVANNLNSNSVTVLRNQISSNPIFSVVPTSVTFGSVTVGSNKRDSVSVSNTGASILRLTSVVSNNAEFTVTPPSDSVPVGGTKKFYITFTPTSGGVKSGNITFTHNAAGSPSTVTIGGTGLAPLFSIAPASLPFGNVEVGFNKRDSMTVTNTGTAPLTITSVTSSNAQFVVTPTSGSVAPSTSLKFYVTFTPTSSGLKSGAITFNHNAAGSPSIDSVNGTGTVPSFSAFPTSINFGSIAAGSTKIDSIVVLNSGTAMLRLTNVSSNNAEFSVIPTNDSVPAGGNKKFYVTFAPVSGGAKSGSIIFTDNASGSPHSVGVSGTGLVPLFAVTPTSLAFGNVDVGQNKRDSVTVTNNGGAQLTITSVTSSNAQFAVTPTSGSVAPSTSLKFYITFTPTSSGLKSGAITFNHNAAGSPSIDSVNGTGTIPLFSITPVNLTFGNVDVGQSKMDSMTVTNNGGTPLTITSVTSSNAQFVVSPTSGSVAPSTSLKFYVTFTPSSSGLKSGAITFNHNAAGSPTIDSVNGTGAVPVFSALPTSINFGSIAVGSSKIDSIVVSNSGAAMLRLTNVSSNNAEFSVTPSNDSVPGGGSKKFYVTFAPLSGGAKSGSIIFTDNASGSPHSVGVSGTGLVPLFSVTPTSLAFGNVDVGQSKMDSMTVTNNGGAQLTITSVTSSNGQFVVTPTSGSVAPSTSLKFYITFTPTSSGLKSGAITFNHNAAGSPSIDSVNGTGAVPGFSVSPTSLNFGLVNLFSGGKQDSVTVTNTGSGTLSITSVTSDNAQFTFTPASATVAPLGTRTFYITFTPTSVGLKNGTITLNHNASGSPGSVSVSGSGGAQQFSVSPASIVFGNLYVGAFNQDSVNVSNPGTSPLTISSVTSTIPEFQVTPTSAVLNAGESKKFYISFTPITVGVKNGAIVFNHNAVGSPSNVNVSGVALDPNLKLVLTATNGSAAIPGIIIKNDDKMLDAISTRTLAWGVHHGASYGIWGVDSATTAVDSIEGEFELPPILGGMFDVRFADIHGGVQHFGDGALIDIRDFSISTQIDSYKVILQPGPAGFPIKLQWSKLIVSSSYVGPVTMKTNLGGTVDMKNVDSLLVTNPLITDVQIIAEIPNLPLIYEKGWNMASLAVRVPDARKSVLFPTSNSRAIAFSDQGGFAERDTLVPGTGYWLKFPTLIQSVSFTGTPRLRDTIAVTSDWNLIGSLSNFADVASITTIPSGIIVGDFFGYSHGYYVANTLEPFQAYWVRTSQAGQIIMRAQGGGGNAFSVPMAKLLSSRVPNTYAELTLRDAVGNTGTLYLGSREGTTLPNLKLYEMPPAPPRGGFDIRFSSQRMLEMIDERRSQEFPIHLRSVQYPLTVDWKMNSQSASVALDLGNQSYLMNGQGSVQIAKPSGITDAEQSTMTLKVVGSGVPKQFSLAQNYPNPFNSTTIINFGLSTDAFVTIKLYNLLGQEIITLLDKKESAGERSVAFDANNLPSGVYFYRIVVEPLGQGINGTQHSSFTSTKSMILLK